MTLTTDYYTDVEMDESQADLVQYGTAWELLDNGGCTVGTNQPLFDKQIAFCVGIVSAYEQAQRLVDTEARREPDSCTHCGVSETGHARRWAKDVLWHDWAAPTEAQQLLRVNAKRAVQHSHEWVLVGQEFRRILAEAERAASRG